MGEVPQARALPKPSSREPGVLTAACRDRKSTDRTPPCHQTSPLHRPHLGTETEEMVQLPSDQQAGNTAICDQQHNQLVRKTDIY